jgi:hypothetical protein
MSRTTRVMDCSPEDVFAVLEDGWSYGMWVVGAARIRDVEAAWPAVGSKVHHSVGVWPMLLSDNTEVEAAEAPRMLQLRVRAWPAGTGRVTLTCEAKSGKTVVVMEERATSGPASMLPNAIEDLMLRPRNVEALRRLSYLAERHARSRG